MIARGVTLTALLALSIGCAPSDDPPADEGPTIELPRRETPHAEPAPSGELRGDDGATSPTSPTRTNRALSETSNVPAADPEPPPAPTTKPLKCVADTDCRTFASYCGGCSCSAGSVKQAEPSCAGEIVACTIDPCTLFAARCELLTGTCVLR